MLIVIEALARLPRANCPKSLFDLSSVQLPLKPGFDLSSAALAMTTQQSITSRIRDFFMGAILARNRLCSQERQERKHRSHRLRRLNTDFDYLSSYRYPKCLISNLCPSVQSG